MHIKHIHIKCVKHSNTTTIIHPPWWCVRFFAFNAKWRRKFYLRCTSFKWLNKLWFCKKCNCRICTHSATQNDSDTCELNAKCRKPSSVGRLGMASTVRCTVYFQFNIANKLKWVKTLALPCFDRLAPIFLFVAQIVKFVVD